MDIDSARIFAKIVEQGSFSSAAEYLDIPKATVSRKIASLEENLGVRLLERSTRSLRLTPNGEKFLQYALQISQLADEIKKDFQSLQEEPQGTLNIAVSSLVGELMLQPIILEYMKRFPLVQLSVVHTEEKLDPLKESLDVMIWVGTLPKANLIAKWISNSWRILVASPDYLKQHGHPSTIDCLRNHKCIQYEGRIGREWSLQSEKKSCNINTTFYLQTNNFWLARNATLSGKGIALLPAMLLGEDLRNKNLIHVLPEWYDHQESVYAIFPSRKLLAIQVRAFLDMIDAQRDRNLTRHNVPSFDDPHIRMYMETMKLTEPRINFSTRS